MRRIHHITHILIRSLVRLWLLNLDRTVFLNDVGLQAELFFLKEKDSSTSLLSTHHKNSSNIPICRTVASVTCFSGVADKDVSVFHGVIVLVIVTSEDRHHFSSLDESTH